VLMDLERRGLIERGRVVAEGPERRKSRFAEQKYPGFIFNPFDLREECDLEVEARKDVLFFEAMLDRWNYFELLEVDTGADAVAVKAAYFEKSKRFHPDRYFRKNLASFKKRMEIIFKALTEAYETLADPARREAYCKEKGIEVAAAAPAPTAASPQAYRQEARLRRNPMLDRLKKAKEYFQSGKAAFDAGDFNQAATLLQTASMMDPGNAEFRELLGKVDTLVADQRADQWAKRALFAESVGRIEETVSLYHEAAKANPANPLYQAKIAELLLINNARLHEAREAAQEAVRLAPENGEYHQLLADVYSEVGLTLNAQREYALAQTLPGSNPDHIKERLRRLKLSLR
jgi:curved DNA-binding protein CbpA